MNIKGLKHGDITTWAQQVLRDGLESIINAKAARRTPYFIMVIIKEGYDGPPPKKDDNHLLHGSKTRSTGRKTIDLSGKRVVTNRFLVLDEAPLVRMIGSSLWRIDNKTGEVRCLYILPPDKPMIGGFSVGVDSEMVAKSAKGMPIVYGAN